jgi:hypothetical protein
VLSYQTLRQLQVVPSAANASPTLTHEVAASPLPVFAWSFFHEALQRTALPQRTPAAAPVTALAKKAVLVVDDDAGIRQVSLHEDHHERVCVWSANVAVLGVPQASAPRGEEQAVEHQQQLTRGVSGNSRRRHRARARGE